MARVEEEAERDGSGADVEGAGDGPREHAAAFGWRREPDRATTAIRVGAGQDKVVLNALDE